MKMRVFAGIQAAHHKIRLFIAVDCGELKDYFLEIQKKLPKVDLSLVKGFHLTLKFLGEVQPSDATKISSELRKIKFEEFDFHLEKTGYFERKNEISILWIGIKPEDKAMKLQEEVDETLKDYFDKEKGYRPHITLARVKNIENKNEFLKNFNNIQIEKKKIKVINFKLMQSILTSQGLVNKEVEVFS